MRSIWKGQIGRAVALVFLLGVLGQLVSSTPALPNVVIIYVDDMGYGDLGVQNPDSLIPTPHLDQLARDVYAFYKRSGKWKYVYYTSDLQKSVASLPFNIKHILTDAPLRRRGDQNLYNLEADPYELNDLSQEPEHQAMLKDFRDEVFKWWEETGGAQIP